LRRSLAKGQSRSASEFPRSTIVLYASTTRARLRMVLGCDWHFRAICRSA
jgi:hypothetical protein